MGFRDDHLPWASPARWRALFDPTKVKATVHGAPPDFSPGQVPKQAWQFPSWVGPEYNLSDTKWLQPPQLQEALRSYMGNIAFVRNATVIVLLPTLLLTCSDPTSIVADL